MYIDLAAKTIGGNPQEFLRSEDYFCRVLTRWQVPRLEDMKNERLSLHLRM